MIMEGLSAFFRAKPEKDISCPHMKWGFLCLACAEHIIALSHISCKGCKIVILLSSPDLELCFKSSENLCQARRYQDVYCT